MLVRDIPQDAPGSNKQPRLPGEMDHDAVLARRVRELRVKAGLTQRQLADLMSGAGYRMHQTTIAKIESGERPVVVGEAIQLAGVLGVTLPALLTEPPSDDERRLHEAQIAVVSLQRELAERQKALDEVRILHENTRRMMREAVSRLDEMVAEIRKVEQ
jgi:transcriptional regulator with XRE-family HTH domain